MEITHVRDMNKTMQAIALEASVLPNVVGTIKNFFPDLVHQFKASFVGTSELEKADTKPVKLEKELVDFLKKNNYIDLMNVSVTVPEGFDAEFIYAIEVMDQATAAIQSLINRDIRDFRVYVSTFLTNKDTKISLKDLSLSFENTDRQLRDLNELYAQLYKQNSFESTKPLKTLVKRNADIETVLTKLVHTKSKLNQIDISALKSLLQDIAHMLESIVDQVQNKKIENVSPEAIINLTHGTQVTAKAAETISASYFRTMTIINAIERLPQELVENHK